MAGLLDIFAEPENAPGKPPQDDLLSVFAEPEQAPAPAGGLGQYLPDLPSAGAIAEGMGLGALANQGSDFLAGFNQRAAQALALPGATVDAMLQQIGIDLFAGRDPAQTGLNQFKQAFRDAGVNVDPGDTYGAQAGALTLDSMISTAALLAAAPKLAAQTGTSVTDFISREMGGFIQKNPGLFAAGEFASVPGTVVGADLGGRAGETVADTLGVSPEAGKMVGQTLGGAVGGGVTGLTAPVGAGKFKTRDAIGEKVMPPGEAADIQKFAKKAVTGDIAKMDATIEYAVNRLRGPNISAEQQASSIREELNSAYRAARNQEGVMWRRVDDTVPLDGEGLQTFLHNMHEDTVVNGGLGREYPQAYADRIEQVMYPKGRGTPEKPNPPQPIRTSVLKGLRSDALAEIRQLEVDGSQNQGLISNLGRLADEIADQLADQHPDNAALQQARAFSKALNDRFTRGPVADVMRRRYGGDVYDPGQTSDVLFNPSKYQAPEKLRMITEGIPGSEAQTANPSLKGEIETGIKTYLRRELIGASDEEVARKVDRFIQQHRRLLDEYDAVGNDFKAGLEELNTGLTAKREIERSALQKYSNQSGEATVRDLMGNRRDGAKAAAELVERMGDDQNALDGLRGEAIANLLNHTRDGRGVVSVFKLRNLLDVRQNADLNRTLQEILEPDQLAALRQIARDGVDAAEGTLGKSFRVATIGARLLGATAARIGGKLTGLGGTIQGPQMASNLAAEWVDKAYRGLDLGVLVEAAILNPKMRGILHAKVPRTPGEVRSLAHRMRMITSGVKGGLLLPGTPLQVEVNRPANYDAARPR